MKIAGWSDVIFFLEILDLLKDMIESLLMRLKLWSFLILPIIGFICGQVLQLGLGIKNNPKFEALLVHIITVALMLIIFSDLVVNPEIMKDQKDRVLFISISYLFVLSMVLGLIANLF